MFNAQTGENFNLGSNRILNGDTSAGAAYQRPLYVGRNTILAPAIYEPKSGSSTTADRAKSLKGFKISTASQFTLRVITDSVTIACGLTTYLIWVEPTAGFRMS